MKHLKYGTPEYKVMEDVADLLKQSKWIGVTSNLLTEIYCLADDIAQDLNYNNRSDVAEELSKAIKDAIEKGFKIKDLIDNVWEECQMNKINALAKEALKADDDWNVAKQLEDWEDKEMEKDYDTVVDYLVPEYMKEGIQKDRSKVKITHTDNVEDEDKFYDLYNELKKLQPIKQVKDYLSIYDVDGTRYATEYAEGGAYAVFYYSAE